MRKWSDETQVWNRFAEPDVTICRAPNTAKISHFWETFYKFETLVLAKCTLKYYIIHTLLVRLFYPLCLN